MNYHYRFTSDSAELPAETTVCNESPEGFISFNGGEEVDWTKKRRTNGLLTDILLPTPAPAYTPTAEEIKQQKFTEINWKYQDKLRKLRDTINALEAQGLSTGKLRSQYVQTVADYKAALLDAAKGC